MKRLKKKTLKQSYDVLVNLPLEVRSRVLAALNLKAVQSFYDILNGVRSLNDAEKKAVAEIFEMSVDDILWPSKGITVE
ncbi:MAG: hypothetical protein ABIQ88_02245 [Chitinophagaceae bacterium]